MTEKAPNQGIFDKPKTGNDLNFREILVTETGVYLDDQHIPAFAITPDVVVGATVSGAQTITLTICADRVFFGGGAKARVEMPQADTRDPALYPPRRLTTEDLKREVSEALLRYPGTRPE
ncbi:hypothetical protein [Pseudoclavibacter sp. JSM 162008]|uniref:hypothetical protein n=1 Tax=Pseudoclavibacter sp. JSM 162008 TaxID=3229855 RepID=UPI0035242FB2